MEACCFCCVGALRSLVQVSLQQKRESNQKARGSNPCPIHRRPCTPLLVPSLCCMKVRSKQAHMTSLVAWCLRLVLDCETELMLHPHTYVCAVRVDVVCVLLRVCCCCMCVCRENHNRPQSISDCLTCTSQRGSFRGRSAARPIRRPADEEAAKFSRAARLLISSA